jgi:hypothetical protein
VLVVGFILTDFAGIVSTGLRAIFLLLAFLQCIVGWGLFKLQNWARIITMLMSGFFVVPGVAELVVAFKSLDILKLVPALLFVTFQGMVIAYLVHPETRQVFEVSPPELKLK